MRLELQIAILFLLSLVALVFHHAVPRHQLVDYRGEDWEAYEVFGGGGNGGASSRVTERGMEMYVDLIDRNVEGFCAAVFRRNLDAPVVDVDWCSDIAVKAYIEGKDYEYFRLFLRNRIPGIFTANDDVSRQYNEVAFKVTDKPQEFVFERARFHVPTWWVEKYATNSEHSIPAFGGIDMIEVSTGSSIKSTKLKLIVEQIEFRGHWISPMVLHRTLLACWLVLGAGVLLQKMLDFKTALEQSNERELRLEQINHSLEFKATELSNLAHHDSLTGLMNRLGILQYTELASDAVHRGEKVSVFVLDIDDFKKLNDTHGHNYGDDVLMAVGDLLDEQTSGMDVFARWGGEEFIAICFGKSEAEALRLAASIGSNIEMQVGVTCSSGVYEIGSQDEEFLEAVDRADRAMYAAKTRGKNLAVSWSAIENSRSAQRESRKVSVS